MLNQKEILSTIEMIDQQHLDITICGHLPAGAVIQDPEAGL